MVNGHTITATAWWHFDFVTVESTFGKNKRWLSLFWYCECWHIVKLLCLMWERNNACVWPTHPEPSRGLPWPLSASYLCPWPPAHPATSLHTSSAPPPSARSTSCLELQEGHINTRLFTEAPFSYYFLLPYRRKTVSSLGHYNVCCIFPLLKGDSRQTVTMRKKREIFDFRAE